MLMMLDVHTSGCVNHGIAYSLIKRVRHGSVMTTLGKDIVEAHCSQPGEINKLIQQYEITALDLLALPAGSGARCGLCGQTLGRFTDDIYPG